MEAFPAELSPASLPPLLTTIRLLRSLGATVQSVSTPLAPHALAVYYTIASAEASSNLARFDGVRYGTLAEGEGYEATRGAGFGKEVKKRVLVGSYALSAE